MKINLLVILFFIQFLFGIDILIGQGISNNELKAKIDTYLNNNETMAVFEFKDGKNKEYW